MTLFLTRKLFIAAAVAAVAAAPLGALPAIAQDSDGVSVTIRKGPSYLNTRTTGRPATQAAYNTSAVTQPFYQQRNSISFARSPLPATFDIPGY